MTAPYYADESVTLYAGDCLDVMRGTPEERAAAVRCLARVSRTVADGAAGLRTVLRALALDDEPERCPGCDQGVKTPTGKCSAGCGWGV